MPRPTLSDCQNDQVTTTVDPDFDTVSGIVVDFMREHGFGDAALTPDAGAGSHDVESATAIAEINTAAPPSRPNVQRLDTVARQTGKRALYFSVRGFTTAAEEWANNVNIALFAFDKDKETIIPANPLAEEIARKPPSREEQLLAAATRAVAVVKEELHEEQMLQGVDEETRKRIQAARETKRMRRNLLG